MITSIHHVAIISSDVSRAKRFYVDILGFRILAEHFREERQSWKIDLAVNDDTQIELFTFPNPPSRVTNPEACGLRHLAFRVDDVSSIRDHLIDNELRVEDIRVDEYTGKKFFFAKDPDDLPIEFYES